MSDAPIPENNEVNNLNRWLVGLVIFVSIWSMGIFIYVTQKSEPNVPTDTMPSLVVDSGVGKIINTSNTNLISHSSLNTNFIPTNEVVHYEQRDTYQKMDFVIIDHFFIEGIVLDKSGDNYTILYRDRNRSLQKIIVPKSLLLVPIASVWGSTGDLRGD